MKIMRSLQIDEISAVDKPAQESAKVAIIKRHDMAKTQKQQDDLITEKEVPVMEEEKMDDEDRLSKVEESVNMFKDRLSKIEEQLKKLIDQEEEKNQDEKEKKQDEEEQKSQEVVYKALDGSAFTTKDDPRLIALAKDRDSIQKKLQEAADKAADLELRKQAANYAFLPGNEDEVVALVGAINTIGDESLRKRAFEMINSQNAMPFKTYGKVDSADWSDSADKELTRMAKQYAQKHRVSHAKAYDAILQTEEGSKLYSEMVG